MNVSEVWFVTGSQHLYGEAALKQKAVDSQEVVAALNGAKQPLNIEFKPVVGACDDRRGWDRLTSSSLLPPARRSKRTKHSNALQAWEVGSNANSSGSGVQPRPLPPVGVQNVQTKTANTHPTADSQSSGGTLATSHSDQIIYPTKRGSPFRHFGKGVAMVFYVFHMVFAAFFGIVSIYEIILGNQVAAFETFFFFVVSAYTAYWACFRTGRLKFLPIEYVRHLLVRPG
jgi:hypothetical protein